MDHALRQMRNHLTGLDTQRSRLTHVSGSTGTGGRVTHPPAVGFRQRASAVRCIDSGCWEHQMSTDERVCIRASRQQWGRVAASRGTEVGGPGVGVGGDGWTRAPPLDASSLSPWGRALH